MDLKILTNKDNYMYLTNTQKKLFDHIFYMCIFMTDYQVTNKDLVRITGIKLDTLKKYLQVLKKDKLIDVRIGPRRINDKGFYETEYRIITLSKETFPVFSRSDLLTINEHLNKNLFLLNLSAERAELAQKLREELGYEKPKD